MNTFFRDHPVVLLLLMFIAGMFAAQFSGMLLLKIFYPAANVQSLAALTKSHPEAWHLVRWIQLLHSTLSMIVPAVVFTKWMDGKWLPYEPAAEKPSIGALVFIPVLLFTLMPLMQTMYVFNQGMDIPGEFGQSLKSMEDQMNGLIEGMLSDSSTYATVFNVFLMVLLAAIAEELFFRGALQRFIIRKTGDEHAGILIAAIFFSSVHMQFYGFLPRLALGILFGYIYFRTKRLVAPILAHAMFNGLQLGTYYYSVRNGIASESEELLLMPVSFTMASTLLFFMMYYSFHAYTEKKK